VAAVSLMPDVVVVGAATRDLDESGHGAWRPGGGVSYGALLLARLGFRVGALVGVDRTSADAGEPAILRAAGVDVVTVELSHGPVFENRERPGGRRQVCHDTSDPLPTSALPPAWRRSTAFLFAPVAAELGPEWADVPSPDATVALGWQGLLRHLVPGRPTGLLVPVSGPVQRRADLAAISREDLPVPAGDASLRGDGLDRLLARPGQALAVTAGRRGGLYLCRTRTGSLDVCAWPALQAERHVDPTGAGDVFLAALLAVHLALGRDRRGERRALRFAAAAASLSVEGVGLSAVPDLARVRRRLLEPPAAG
jgi:sugar/nucleoside kinase (ribokinase family)